MTFSRLFVLFSPLKGQIVNSTRANRTPGGHRRLEARFDSAETVQFVTSCFSLLAKKSSNPGSVITIPLTGDRAISPEVVAA